MKKVLLTGAALMLVGGMVSTETYAAVEPGVKITGDARVRLWYKNEAYDFNSGDSDEDGSANYMDSRIRLNIAGTAAGGAYAKARIRMMENGMGDDDVDSPAGINNSSSNSNIWADLAYIGIPFSDSFTLEAGKYRSTYGPQAASFNFFYDDVHLTGMKGIIKMDNVIINPFIEWMEEGQGAFDSAAGTADQRYDHDSIRYGVHAQAKIDKDWTVGGMLGYQTDSRTETDGYQNGINDEVWGYKNNEGFFGSIYANGKSGQFGVVGELAVTDGDLNGFNSWIDDAVATDYIGSDDTGFGGYVFPNYQVDKLNIGLNLGFTNDGFQPDRAFGFVMLGSTDNSTITAYRIGAGGDWLWAGLVASYQINESLKLTGNFVYADIDAWSNPEDGPRGAWAASSSAMEDNDLALESAWELSAVLQYTISKGADVYFSAGYLSPELEDSAMKDDAAFGALTRFELKF